MTEKKPKQTFWEEGFNPIKILAKATKAVPFVKYAIGLTGIIALISLTKISGINIKVAVWGTIIILCLMVILFLLARLSLKPDSTIQRGATFLMWSIVLVFVSTILCLFTSVFFSYPQNLCTWIDPLCNTKKTINKNRYSTNVTVFPHGKKGKQDIILKEGYVILDYNGERKKESIDEKGRAIFQNLEIGSKIQLQIEFSEPYTSLYADSIYTIPANGAIYMPIYLQNIDIVKGLVLFNDLPLEGVIVKIDTLITTTDSLGNYHLNIPERLQASSYLIQFSKPGFKTQIEKAYPQTGQPLNLLMKKK